MVCRLAHPGDLDRSPRTVCLPLVWLIYVRVPFHIDTPSIHADNYTYFDI